MRRLRIENSEMLIRIVVLTTLMTSITIIRNRLNRPTFVVVPGTCQHMYLCKYMHVPDTDVKYSTVHPWCASRVHRALI